MRGVLPLLGVVAVRFVASQNLQNAVDGARTITASRPDRATPHARPYKSLRRAHTNHCGRRAEPPPLRDLVHLRVLSSSLSVLF